MTAKEEIVAGILSLIEIVSNPQFQQAAWVEMKVPHLFFEEVMNKLFDDYDFSEILDNYLYYNISKEQYKILKKFHEMLDQYADEKMSAISIVDPKEVLADPRWHAIQREAKEVLKAFHYQKISKLP